MINHKVGVETVNEGVVVDTTGEVGVVDLAEGATKGAMDRMANHSAPITASRQVVAPSDLVAQVVVEQVGLMYRSLIF